MTDDSGIDVVPVVLPFQLPPAQYSATDVAWAVDAEHSGRDVRGNLLEEAWALSSEGLSEEAVAAYFQENN
jgi:hypothetical protein